LCTEIHLLQLVQLGAGLKRNLLSLLISIFVFFARICMGQKHNGEVISCLPAQCI